MKRLVPGKRPAFLKLHVCQRHLETFPAEEVEIFARGLVQRPTGQAGGRTATSRPPSHGRSATS